MRVEIYTKETYFVNMLYKGFARKYVDTRYVRLKGNT